MSRLRDDPTDLPDDYDSFSLTGNSNSSSNSNSNSNNHAESKEQSISHDAHAPNQEQANHTHTHSSTATTTTTSTSSSSATAMSVYDEEPPQCSMWFEPKDWSRRYAPTFFTCSIISHHMHPEEAGVVLYDIQVKCAVDTWTVSHRFSEFEQLLQVFKQEISRSDQTALSGTSLTASARVTRASHTDEKSCPASPTWPILPSKTWSPHGDTSPEFLNERQEKLNTFLFELLRLRPKIGLLPSLRTFLDLDHALTPTPEEED